MKQMKRLALLLPAIIAALIFSCNQQQENNEEAAETTTTIPEPVSQQQKPAPDKKLLIGDWTRTDAAYRLQITELLDGRIMKAGYFNPRSINVAKATWDSIGGALKIYVELRDENYPGSNYNLTYIPEQDLLAGKYFQAVEGVTYDVEFRRIN
ncbi:MAG TPA: hypothetical protein VIZ28_11645 [Chitinophagaceae bacterium]